MGNLKKLEKVWASKTSLAETEINKPRNAEVTEIKKIPGKAGNQLIPDISVKTTAMSSGKSALKIPKITAPPVLANIKVFKEMGASKRRSKEACFFSKVMVTASMEVVPKSIDRETSPGRKSGISTEPPDLRKNIRVQEKGNIIPQLILGGFR
jgi:hypothetical protein